MRPLSISSLLAVHHHNDRTSLLSVVRGLHILHDPGVHSALEALSVASELVRALGAGQMVTIADGAVILVMTWSLSRSLSCSELLLNCLVLGREENDLAVRRLGHGLHSLEVSDLHSWCRAQNISGLTHEFGGLDFSPGADDFGFSGSLGLSGHGERVLEFLREYDVLDQHALNLYTPASSRLLDDFADRLCYFFSPFNHILQHSCANNVSERRLRSFHKRCSQVGDSEGGFVWGGDVVVNNRGKMQVDVVLGHTDLTRDFDDLDLDVDLDEIFGERVDFHETWVDCACEAAKSGYEADVSLGYGFVWVGADDYHV